MTFEQFLSVVLINWEDMGGRLGIIFMNTLEMFPLLHDQFAGTDLDPIYAENWDNPTMINACDILREIW